MQLKNRYVAIPLVALLVTLVGTYYAQHRGKPRRNTSGARAQFQGSTTPVATKDIERVAGANALVANDVTLPAPWVIVNSDSPNSNDPIYQQAATLIAGYTAIPAARVAYFAAYNNQIGEFGGFVTTVQSQPGGGSLVTVNVQAILTDSSMPASKYFEQYMIGADNSVTYSSSLDPDGKAGTQLPTMIN